MKYKEIIFLVHEKVHADLKVRLIYDKIPMTKFVRTCAMAYLNNDKRIVQLINEQKEKDKIDNKQKRAANIKLAAKGEELSKTFGLTEEDVKDLYDVIEDK